MIVKNKIDDDKVVHLLCDCGDGKYTSPEHMVTLWDDEDIDDMCYVSCSLNHYLPWYKKIIPAMKYILGIDNTFVFYTEAVLKKSELQEALDFFSEKKG